MVELVKNYWDLKHNSFCELAVKGTWMAVLLTISYFFSNIVKFSTFVEPFMCLLSDLSFSFICFIKVSKKEEIFCFKNMVMITYYILFMGYIFAAAIYNIFNI